jgi:hypothetical protein
VEVQSQKSSRDRWWRECPQLSEFPDGCWNYCNRHGIRCRRVVDLLSRLVDVFLAEFTLSCHISPSNQYKLLFSSLSKVVCRRYRYLPRLIYMVCARASVVRLTSLCFPLLQCFCRLPRHLHPGLHTSKWRMVPTKQSILLQSLSLRCIPGTELYSLRHFNTLWR